LTPEEILAEYRRQHEAGQFRGLTMLEFDRSIGKLIGRFGAKTLLDYGSGKGEAWQTLAPKMGIHVTCYDPGVPRFAVLPERMFHGVICCDVLEHIPMENVAQALTEIFERAERFVWLSVCCRPAKKHFPDGTNMHVTVQPLDWWRARIAEANRLDIPVLLRENL